MTCMTVLYINIHTWSLTCQENQVRLDGVILSDMQQTSRKYFLSATFSLVEVLLGSSEWSAQDSGHMTTTH